jgi:hypothetical protein
MVIAVFALGDGNPGTGFTNAARSHCIEDIFVFSCRSMLTSNDNGFTGFGF